MLLTGTQRCSFADWAARLAFFAVQLLIVAIALHRFAGLATPVALNIAALAFAIAALGMLMAFVSFVRIWREGMGGLTQAVFAMLLGIGLLAWPAAVLPAYYALPEINDITTDVTTPPEFVRLAARPKMANPATYGGSDIAELQTEAYPDIRPIKVLRPAVEAFEITRNVMEKRGLRIITAVAPAGDERAGVIEAVDKTMVLGFDDDLIVRVTTLEEGSRIDVRSASRFGSHDFGRNAIRVRELLKQLNARLDTGSGSTALLSPTTSAFVAHSAEITEDEAATVLPPSRTSPPLGSRQRGSRTPELPVRATAPIDKSRPAARAKPTPRPAEQARPKPQPRPTPAAAAPKKTRVVRAPEVRRPAPAPKATPAAPQPAAAPPPSSFQPGLGGHAQSRNR